MIIQSTTKSMIDLQRTNIDMILNTLGGINEHAGRATQAWFEQMAGIPRTNLESMHHWMNSVRAARDEINAIIHEGFVVWGNTAERTMRQRGEAARKTRQSSTQMRDQDQMAAAARHQPPTENDLEKLKEQLEEHNP